MKGVLHFDGGARNNGHKNPERQCYAAAAAVLTWTGPTTASGIYLGDATNNEAEYSGLLIGLDLAKSHSVLDLIVCGDSKLIIEQSKGNWIVQSETLEPLWRQVQQKLDHFHDVTLIHVTRDENTTADKLVNEILNTRNKRKLKPGDVVDLRELVHPR